MAWIQQDNHQTRDLPEVFQALSLNPEALEAVQLLNESLAFGGSSLSRAQEEAIATVVAVANQCRYDALIHGGFLRRCSRDAELPSRLLHDYTEAGLDPADRRMLDFAVKLTREPTSLTRDDLDGLREVGFEEEEILSIVLTTGLFNLMNRLACALGVDVPFRYQAIPVSEGGGGLAPGAGRPAGLADAAGNRPGSGEARKCPARGAR